MKRLSAFILTLLCTLTILSAQMVNPVKWAHTCKQSGDVLTMTFTASIEKGWHMYGLLVPAGGPQQTEFAYDKLEGAKLQGPAKVTKGSIIKHFDDAFEMELSYYENNLTVEQNFKLTSDTYDIEGYITYMSCCDGMCTPPTTYEFTIKGGNEATNDGTSTTATDDSKTSDSAVSETEIAADSIAADSAAEDNTEANTGANQGLWTPVISQLQQYNANSDITTDISGQSHPWWYILIAGFLAGLIALVTPCVWPMIPMTVSFFLKRTKDRKKSIKDAYTYGISIIVIYVGLGLFVTAMFGASALNSLATNAIFNIVFFLLLLIFAFSFLGGFEIALPEKLTSKLDEKADSTTGLLSIFFMAFTLCLVSFSCTGPIIGTLLVEAATSGSMFYPAIGMFGFALALSLPFTLFALFPSMLKSMPKSGGWLNMVKVVLGFCELALAFKFLSVADLAYGWGILDREVFLCLWIVIFLLLGLYLLGFIRLPHDDDPDPSDRVSVTRLMMALVAISFSIYMVPGLWGAPCKAISAFAPPMYTQDFKLSEQEMSVYHNYEEGMAAAKRAGKPALIDFSGFGCVNCRKMEAAVWTAPEVKQLIENDYILISLMVDDKTALPEVEVVSENGKEIKLRTIGDKWSYLQRSKFGANAQPFYVLLDNEGNPVNGSYSYNEDVDAYVSFLKKGIENYKN